MQKSKALKISNTPEVENAELIHAINPKKNKDLKIKKFVFLTKEIAKKVSTGKYITWKPPKLVEGKKKYIEYYFKVPPGLPPVLQQRHNAPGEWERFRVFKGVAQDPEFALQLLATMLKELENGFSPFQYEIDEYNRILAEQEAEKKAKKQVITLNAASELFLQHYDEVNRKSYAVPLNLLKKHIAKNTLLEESQWYDDIATFTQDDLEDFLAAKREEKEWAPLTYNDKVKKFVTFFNYCKDELQIISKSPAEGVELMRKGTKIRHTPFEDSIIPAVKKAILAVPYWGKYLHDFSEVIYYTGTRPDKETRNLQVENILWGRNKLMIPDEKAKKGRGRFIHMEPELIELFIRMGLKDCPGHYYIFGIDGPPGPVPTNRAFFSDKFRDEVREPGGFSPKLTNYSWKHTRCIHMYMGGVIIALIQQYCGHATPSMTEEYLKDGLGLMLGNMEHDFSRKF